MAVAVRHYQELVAWQKAMDLVEPVYRCCRDFPKDEVFGLTCQVRRASVLVPSNIAEGQGRRTTREFLQFLSIARGSRQEAETRILLAQRLGYIAEAKRTNLLNMSAEVGRLISGLINSLESTE
jgi:four helix bundle protein